MFSKNIAVVGFSACLLLVAGCRHEAPAPIHGSLKDDHVATKSSGSGSSSGYSSGSSSSASKSAGHSAAPSASKEAAAPAATPPSALINSGGCNKIGTDKSWILLSTQSANFIGVDKDSFPVGKEGGELQRLCLSVKDRAITLKELRVVFTSGKDESIPVKEKIESGKTFGPLELNRGGRTIKEIQVRYRSRFFDKSATRKGVATVEVWGQK